MAKSGPVIGFSDFIGPVRKIRNLTRYRRMGAYFFDFRISHDTNIPEIPWALRNDLFSRFWDSADPFWKIRNFKPLRAATKRAYFIYFWVLAKFVVRKA